MNLFGLIFLLVTQYLTGRGLMILLKVKTDRVTETCYAMLCGVGLFAFPPFILQLLHIPITVGRIIVSLLVLTTAMSVPMLLNHKVYLRMPDIKFRWPTMYEMPFYIIFWLLLLLSVWRCFYYPPNARDITSGPELMAKYAILEKTFINSMFSIDLQSTNNYLKPPYIVSLQIIYKMLVSEVGQLWLSATMVSFFIWLFYTIKQKLHPFVACVVMLLFIAVPDLYAYTFIILFDSSNMVFFAGGFYFLSRYLEDKDAGNFRFSVFLFTMATYVRTETLILLALLLPLMAFRMFRAKQPIVKIALNAAVLMIFPALVYFVYMNIYVKYYIPIHFDVSSEINKNLSDIVPLFQRMGDMATKLIFDEGGLIFYAYFFHVFLFVLAIDLAFFRKFNQEALNMLYAVGVVYFGLALVGYILPLNDLNNSTKRGLFKMLPVIILYYSNSPLLLKLTALLTDWESGSLQKPPPPPAAAKVTPKKAAAAGARAK